MELSWMGGGWSKVQRIVDEVYLNGGMMSLLYGVIAGILSL